MPADLSSFIEDVKSRIDIVDVVGEYVDLRKKGAAYMAPCPFHQETKPSFTVNRDRQFYHCFGCNKGGDVFSFLMDITGMSFMEALEHLAERAGMKMPERGAVDSTRREKTDRIIAANLAAAEYYYKTLTAPDGRKGLEYLQGRGLSQETIHAFRLGFAPADPKKLMDFAASKHVDFASLDAAGILAPAKYGGPPYNRFADRVMFPIIDQAKRILGFGGRILEGEGAKYVNSSDSPVYHKSRVLFGIHQAHNAIKKSRTAVVVEGYMDVISLHQAGIRNVIAASGTAFTEEQGRMIARMARNAVLLFDGDPAGMRAAARGADNLLVTDLSIGVVVLPDGHDPDSFVRENGPEALQERLADAADIWEFKLDVLGSNIENTKDRLALAGEIADSIARIPDDLKREVYIKDLSKRTGIDPNAMRKAVGGRVRRQRRGNGAVTEKQSIAGTHEEQVLLCYLVQYPHFIRHFMEEAGGKPFITPVYQKIIDEVFHRHVEGLEISPSALMSHFTDKEIQELIAAVSAKPVGEEMAEAYFDGFYKNFRIKELRKRYQELSTIISGEPNEKKVKKLLEEKQDIYTQLKDYEKGNI